MKDMLLYRFDKKDKKARLEKNTATPADDKASATKQLSPSSALLVRMEASIESEEDRATTTELTKSDLNLFHQTMDRANLVEVWVS